MLLKLIEENQETRIELSILGKIEHLDTVRIEPYLDYSRRLLRERTGTMNAGVAEIASRTLARHGTKEDGELLEWVLKERPYVEYGVTKSLKILRDRLNSQPTTRPERHDKTSPGTESATRPADGAERNSAEGKTSAAPRTRSWILCGLILVILFGAFSLIFKRPHRPRT